jgi:anaphase-promoting complex subunit 11
MQVKIKNWHAVALWKWNVKDEVCGICRIVFDACCPECKLPGDDCPLSKFRTPKTWKTILTIE